MTSYEPVVVGVLAGLAFFVTVIIIEILVRVIWYQTHKKKYAERARHRRT